ncbi:MAG: 50S ribosomal protein L11 methyltransferase [Lewinellaceae bacterium]|nr:50S ribosomal protein L11 methyltransferase [Lewinellaceae bacterium]
MDYWKYTLRTDPDTAQVLLAYLSEAPFDTFEEMEEGLDCYLPASGSKTEADQMLEDLSQQFPFTVEQTFLPAQNWNEIWESNFQPVIVGDFCAVRADFHPPQPGVKWELVINPKMAFGTGHHETTWQCIAAMEHLPLAGRQSAGLWLWHRHSGDPGLQTRRRRTGSHRHRRRVLPQHRGKCAGQRRT